MQHLRPRHFSAFLLGISALTSGQALPLTSHEFPLARTAMGDDLRPNQVGAFVLKTNRTHVTWSGPDGDGDGIALDPFVSTVDHTTQSVHPNVQAGRNPAYDTHNYPKLGATPDGRIFITYGAHNDNIRIAMESAPGTLNFKELSVATPDGSYPNPVLSRLTGRIYLFYRRSDDFGSGGTDPHRPLAMVYSDDNGSTWTTPVDIIDRAAPGGADDPDSDPDDLDEIYLGNVALVTDLERGTEQIWLCWTLAGGPTHDDYHGNIYAAYLDPLDNQFYDAKGQCLGPKIQGVHEMDSADFHILAFASPRPVTTKNTGYVNHVSLGADRFPLINEDLKFDGTGWTTIPATGLGGDNVRGAWSQFDEDGTLWHFRAMDMRRVYRSRNGGTWEEVLTSNAPVTGYGQGIPVEVPANLQAFLFSKEGTKGDSTNLAYLSGSDMSLPANRLVLEVEQPKAARGSTVRVNAYTVGNHLGFLTKDTTVTAQIHLTAPGLADSSSRRPASKGVAAFDYMLLNTGRTRLMATAPGLDTAYAWVEATGQGSLGLRSTRSAGAPMTRLIPGGQRLHGLEQWGNRSYAVLGLQGKVIRNGLVPPSGTLDLSFLPEAIHLLRVGASNEPSSR